VTVYSANTQTKNFWKFIGGGWTQ